MHVPPSPPPVDSLPRSHPLSLTPSQSEAEIALGNVFTTGWEKMKRASTNVRSQYKAVQAAINLAQHQAKVRRQCVGRGGQRAVPANTPQQRPVHGCSALCMVCLVALQLLAPCQPLGASSLPPPLLTLPTPFKTHRCRRWMSSWRRSRRRF